jgi:hypothetical protein
MPEAGRGIVLPKQPLNYPVPAIRGVIILATDYKLVVLVVLP